MDLSTSSRDNELPHIDFTPNEDVEIVIVDDNRQTLDHIARYLEQRGYRVRPFTDPLHALDAMRDRPPALLITDVVMPGMGGLELLDQAAGIDPEIRVLVMTGQGNEATAQAALRAGVDDYLTKPFRLLDLDQAIQRSVGNRQQARHSSAVRSWLEAEVERQTTTIQEVSLGAVRALVTALEARNQYFKGHSESVALSAQAIARRLRFAPPELEAIRTAALLHDVGMIGVPDSIVEKPEGLSPEEYRLVQEHCQTGARILEPLSHLGPVARYVLEHHERIDGSGYPYRKEGQEVSLGGQIVGLAETWTALSESRPYRSKTSPREAVRLLEGTAGNWYREDLIQALASLHTA